MQNVLGASYCVFSFANSLKASNVRKYLNFVSHRKHWACSLQAQVVTQSQ